MFKKILIANRGEIAVRLVRACRELAIGSVAVYSEVDRTALHVRLADEAYPLGPAPAKDSYLNVDKLLAVARRAKVEAIHPGYGFLAENESFAEACQEAGIHFIGPSPAALRSMGDKTAARQMMTAAGVPIVPGTIEGLQSEEEAERVAAEVGYPILLKAAAGGGGKGMRVVNSPEDLHLAIRGASSEAGSSFGESTLYIEKLMKSSRHIEVQLLADSHGNIVYLGERECSIQRRHQKLLEESPSVAIDPDLRRRLGETAVRAARAANYSSAGTVEFLLGAGKQFYFLEMNTRLQVEHPVTEMATGIDMVREQIRLAAGETLNLRQEDIAPRGAVIECRICAEDPTHGFMPSTGIIGTLREPSGPGVRVDSCAFEGMEVGMHYDPMIAKLITSGSTRTEAIDRMRRALREYYITGIRTTIPFHRFVMENESFHRGDFDTGFVDKEWKRALEGLDEGLTSVAAMAAAWYVHGGKRAGARPCEPSTTGSESNWKILARRDGLRRSL